jgi:2-oxoglutarate ferredoxin oxidoreductase subunit gamma
MPRRGNQRSEKGELSMRLNVRFAGAGGQGVILSSVLLAKAYGLGENFNVTQTQSYGPEARGGACKAEVVISDEEIDYMKVDNADVLIAYNQTGFDKYCIKSKEKDIVLVNSTLVASENPRHYRIPATQIAEEMGRPQAVNMVMLGALTKLMPKLHYSKVAEAIEKDVPASAVRSNQEAFDKGYRYMEGICGLSH